ncbi:uroporphyrinogen-III C-methyltransferase [Pseudoalteromonas sp. T1lg21]|uniref:uroporphyrinogen-III C-methyltransferase n=1 Tax=Pseudoalteromonas sp. T1lg21 TaxID=2077095 RepID=UPI0018F8822B|nr:uroporphyrinogen-III C-methyltransferase [Pseudoalteromonas sp. T1lg21]
MMVSQMVTFTNTAFKTVLNVQNEWLHKLKLAISNTHTKPFKRSASKNGQVYLIGAGSGDPELLTLKAHRILQHADVVLVDWLVNSEIQQYFPAHVEVIFVGKRQGCHSMSQAQICQLLVAKALENKTVVRLKGGDPSLFGRLSEETHALAEHDIPFAIVPGVTAASTCAAYTGIPLTDRRCSQAVQFVTAHCKDDAQQANWSQLVASKQTLVFYMGLTRVDSIAKQLIKHKMSPDMPIAVVDKGSLTDQQLCCRTLASIDAERDLKDFVGPALVIVGDVVNYRQRVDLTLLQANYFVEETQSPSCLKIKGA